jgi:glycosyltransferase involved in cell wall biosynthesis
LERITLSIPNYFVAVSPSIKNSFVKQFNLRKKNLSNSVKVIKNGVDVFGLREKAKKNPLSRKSFRLPRYNCELNDDDFIIGTVGRLHPVKRYDFLIKSFSKFLNRVNIKNSCSTKKRVPKLCFVGDGSERSALEDLVKDLKLQNYVLFLGEQSEVYKYYSLFDCFVLSSQTEGLSIALLEALSFGLPIVTTCENEKHDVITDGVNGIVVPINNENDLPEAFGLLYTNEIMRISMRKKNLVFVEEKFCIKSVVHQYSGLYKSVL